MWQRRLAVATSFCARFPDYDPAPLTASRDEDIIAKSAADLPRNLQVATLRDYGADEIATHLPHRGGRVGLWAVRVG